MPQYSAKDTTEIILKSIIGVISRRTSEKYANVIISNVVKDLQLKYDFLKFIKISGSEYSELLENLKIENEINYIDSKEVGLALKELIEKVTHSMGQSAEFFFIKEVKDGLPFGIDDLLRNLGVDLNMMQLDYITEKKGEHLLDIENSELLFSVFKSIFEILDKEISRDYAYKTINELVDRFITKYEVLRYVKVNDIRSVQGAEIISVLSEVNNESSRNIGMVIQKIIQETNNYTFEKAGFSIVEKLKNNLASNYILKLEELGADLNVIHLPKELIFKHVIIALIDVLSESSTQSYAVLILDNILKKISDRFNYLKYVRIDSSRYSEGINAVEISNEMDSVRVSEMGRIIQKIVENVLSSLGENAGQNFIDRFKRRLGEAYLLRIEEMGVNLHMIQLKQDFLI